MGEDEMEAKPSNDAANDSAMNVVPNVESIDSLVSPVKVSDSVVGEAPPENHGEDAERLESDAANIAPELVAADSPSMAWTLPIRAAPILALQGEQVIEFPLSQHASGLESISVVMDDELMRIVESRYDSDGVRRLNVRLALEKKSISGYSHTHLNIFQKLQAIWWASIGLGIALSTSLAQGLLALGGSAFVLTGIGGLLMAKLDLHRLSFSDHGGRHDFYLSGWAQDPYLIHNSTALLGPAVVDFLRTGEFNTQHIDAVIASMAKVTPAPVPQQQPSLAAPELQPQHLLMQDTHQEPSRAQEPLPTGQNQAHVGPPSSTSPAKINENKILEIENDGLNGVKAGNSTPPSLHSVLAMPTIPSPPVATPLTTPPATLQSAPLPPAAPIRSPVPPPPQAIPPRVAQTVAMPLPPPPPQAAPAALPPAPLPPPPLPPPSAKFTDAEEAALWGDLQ